MNKEEIIKYRNYRETMGKSVLFKKPQKLPFKEIERLAELGVMDAMLDLANMLYFGKSFNICECFKAIYQDEKKAIKWYLKLVDLGYAPAQYIIGEMYEAGREGFKQDKEKARSLWIEAGNQGDQDAITALAELYEDEENYTESLKWWEQAGGGEYYYDADRVANKLRDNTKEIQALTEKAEQGYIKAQYRLGCYYQDNREVKPDAMKAFYYFTKAAKQGHIFAQEELGFMYFSGRGVKQDYNTAIELFTKSAEQGNRDAQYQLGMIYRKGLQGVKKDINKAIFWYTKAAEQGHCYAQRNLKELVGKKKFRILIKTI